MPFSDAYGIELFFPFRLSGSATKQISLINMIYHILLVVLHQLCSYRIILERYGKSLVFVK
jgi:hypothetical protein